MSRVHLDGYLEVTADRLEAVRSALPEHVRLTRAEPGCIRFEVAESPDNPLQFLVSEVFADQVAFAAHQQRAQASDWARVTAGMPRHYTIRTEDGASGTA